LLYLTTKHVFKNCGDKLSSCPLGCGPGLGLRLGLRSEILLDIFFSTSKTKTGYGHLDTAKQGVK